MRRRHVEPRNMTSHADLTDLAQQRCLHINNSNSYRKVYRMTILQEWFTKNRKKRKRLEWINTNSRC